MVEKAHTGRHVTSDLYDRLGKVLFAPDFDWTLTLHSTDDTNRLRLLLDGLKNDFSTTGEGKLIEGGLSYWGIESTVAWLRASNDPLYTVGKVSAETFAKRWREVRGDIGDTPFHYVSLGPGDGAKDHTVLREPGGGRRVLSYIPVDISTEMLRQAARRPLGDAAIDQQQIFPIHSDFADPDDRHAVRTLLMGWLGAERRIFSLLGNTVGNYSDDAGLLKGIRYLMQDDDLLLLEAATTEELNDELLKSAAREYQRVHGFREFAASTLRHATDLRVDPEQIEVLAHVEPNRSLYLKFVYRNTTGESIPVSIADQATILFRNDDTIRLIETRKYLRSCLIPLVKDCGFDVVRTAHTALPGPVGTLTVRPRFGMELLLLRRSRPAEPGAPVPSQLDREAEAVFPGGPRNLGR